MDVPAPEPVGHTRSAGLDEDSAGWIAALTGGGPGRKLALARLHTLLVGVATAEVRRRGANSGVVGPDADDLAHQAANDALIAILAKLRTFRGESRFTTWTYRFTILEVSNKLGRHYRRTVAIRWDAEDWERLPDRLGVEPDRHAELQEMVAAVRCAVDETLTEHQRTAFVAIVLNGVPLDAAVGALGPSRNAIYKTIFDSRRKIRAHLVAKGHLPDDSAGTRRRASEGEA